MHVCTGTCYNVRITRNQILNRYVHALHGWHNHTCSQLILLLFLYICVCLCECVCGCGGRGVCVWVGDASIPDSNG